MATAWFILLAVMLAVYVVLDGFDLGAGILHLSVAKTDAERRTVLAAIGPVWDGNEVWLIAFGGTLVYTFPRVYAAGFSGFYMPLMMVLWLLILRGISIEFRSQEAAHLWRSFWDGCFCVSSSLLAIVLGAALGNVIRGVPIEASGFFSGPLFTNFLPGGRPGVLDWYTVLVGLYTLAVLAGHGALYLAVKTDGPLGERSWVAAHRAWIAALVVGIPATIATAWIRPRLVQNLAARPLTWILVAGVVVGLAGVFTGIRKRQEARDFGASVCFLVCTLAATAAGLYPDLLTSTVNAANTLTVSNAAAGDLSLRIGFVWWSAAIILAIGYFAYLFHSFRGKVTPDSAYHSGD